MGTDSPRSLSTTLRVDDEILLRWPSMADAEVLFALVDSNRDHLGRWLHWVGTVRTVEDERRWVENRLTAEARGQGTPPLIIYRGTLVGAIGFDRIDSLNKACEVGYWMAEDAQGSGIVTRTCHALIDYAFDQLGMNRVQIRAATDNKRSRAIPERLGLVFEGIQRQAGLVRGEFQDIAVYSMLASEWTDR